MPTRNPPLLGCAISPVLWLNKGGHTMPPDLILWIYIVLLLVGGLIGFFKAKSQVSLVMSAAFAAALVLCAVPGVFDPGFRKGLANVLMAGLLVVFAIRLAKTKK